MDIQTEAEINESELVIVLTNSDEVNILACLVAKKLGAVNTVARVRNPDYIKQSLYMKNELGISMILNPEKETADELFDLINLPSVAHIERFARGRVSLVSIDITNDSPLNNETLISIGKKFNTKVLICAVQRGHEVFIPSGNFTIKEGDKIHFTSDAASLGDFLREINLVSSPIKKIMIVGGGTIGYYLAKKLSRRKYIIKIIEHNKSRADHIAELLPNASIIYGDGTKHDLLLEEGIEAMDAFIPLTGIDEENIIVSMYANKQKVRKIITKTNREELSYILDEVGIKANVSPKDIVSSSVIRYIRALANTRGSNIMTLYRLVNNQVEALEFTAKTPEDFYNKPLKELKIKDNCLIACIIRNNKVLIPGGDDYITLGDSVITVTTHKNFDDLADIFR